MTFLLASLFLVGLWTYRNYRIYDTFVLISTNFGVNLALGNSEFTNVNAVTDINFLDKWPIMHQLSEIEQNVYLKQQAFNFIRDNPLQAIKLYWAKLLNYFNYHNQLATASQILSARDILMLFTYGALLWIASIRILIYKLLPFNRFECLLLLSYLLSALVSAIIFTRIRLRIPFDYLLILFDAISLERVLVFLQKRQASP